MGQVGRTLPIGQDMTETWKGVEPSIARLLDESGQATGIATLIDAKGLFIAHRSSLNGSQAIGLLSGNIKCELSLIAEDKQTDLVLLQAKDWTEVSRSPISVSTASGPKVEVILASAAGPLKGYLTNRNQIGIMDQTGQSVPLLEVQMETPLYPVGGAAIISKSGELVGIIGAMLTSPAPNRIDLAELSRNNQFGPRGLTVTYAIAPLVLDRVVKGFRTESHQVLHPTIGLYWRKSDDGSIVVDRVAPNGPAASAGIMAGDIILQFQAKPVTDPVELAKLLFEKSPGDQIEITVLRNGEQLKKQVTVDVQSASENN